MLHEDLAWHCDLRSHAFAAGLEEVNGGGLLLRVEVTRQHVMEHFRTLFIDPFAGNKGRPADHVLARSVAGGVVEPREHHAVHVVALNVVQLAH